MKQKREVSMLMVKSSIKFSDIHGIGCFSAEDIKAGQVVWRLDSGFDVEISEEDLLKQPASVIDFFKTYSYGQTSNGKKTYILCGDHARHMNHSDDPNVLEAGEGNAFNIAARDIKAGEELTCNYLEFDSDAKLKLTSKNN
jgi:SET domain-containing protein